MDYVNSLLPLLQLQRGQKYNYPTAVEYPATLEDPFDRARGLVNRMVVRPAIGAVSGISGIGAASQGRNALAAQINTQQWLEPLAQLSEPQTEGGKRLARYVDWPMERLAQGGEYVGDKIMSTTGNPYLSTGAYTAVQAAPMVLGFRGKGGKPRPAETRVVNEFSPKALEYTPKTAEYHPMGPVLLNEGMGKSLYDVLLGGDAVWSNEGKGGPRNVNKPTSGNQGFNPTASPTKNEIRRPSRYDVESVAAELGQKPEAIRSAASDYSLQGRQSQAFKEWSDGLPTHRLESIDVTNPKPGVVLVKSSQHKGLESWDPTKASENRISMAGTEDRFWGTTKENADLHGVDRPDNTTSEYYLKANNPTSIKMENRKQTQAAMFDAKKAGHDVAYLYNDAGSRFAVHLDPTSSGIKSRSNIGTFSGQSPNYFYEGMGEALYKTVNNPNFKVVENPEKTQMWRADWGQDLKSAEFEPSRYGWTGDQLIPEGKRFSPSKSETYHGLTTPAEDWLYKGKVIRNRLDEDYGFPIDQQQWSVGRPAPGSKMVEIDHRTLEDFAETNDMDDKALNKYFTDQGITHLRVNNMMTDTGEITPSREIVQLVPGVTKLRGRTELYEGMGQVLYNTLKGGIPNATQDREK